MQNMHSKLYITIDMCLQLTICKLHVLIANMAVCILTNCLPQSCFLILILKQASSWIYFLMERFYRNYNTYACIFAFFTILIVRTVHFLLCALFTMVELPTIESSW
ncbi:putative nucleolar protein 56 [Iris pallida]|uniref:Nucleolar protein 56 n=1 Tax=Iris pallida TaxID=29817 RepID=A0AAX6GX79_IRIPA|nr:putative nucleolar protein 56 [Iris pallida]